MSEVFVPFTDVSASDKPDYSLDVQPRFLTVASVGYQQISGSKTARVTNTGTKAITIKRVRVVGDFLLVHDAPPVLEPGESFQVALKFKPRRVGATEGGVVIEAMDGGYITLLRLLAVGLGDPLPQVQGLEATPSPLNFGYIAPGSTSRTMYVAVKNISESIIVIEDLFASSSVFKKTFGLFPIALNPGATRTFGFRAAPVQTGGKEGSFSLANSYGPDLVIPASIAAAESTGLVITPSLTQMGVIPVNEERPVSWLVTNNFDVPVPFTSADLVNIYPSPVVTFNNQDGNVAPGTASIPPNGGTMKIGGTYKSPVQGFSEHQLQGMFGDNQLNWAINSNTPVPFHVLNENFFRGGPLLGSHPEIGQRWQGASYEDFPAFGPAIVGHGFLIPQGPEDTTAELSTTNSTEHASNIITMLVIFGSLTGEGAVLHTEHQGSNGMPTFILKAGPDIGVQVGTGPDNMVTYTGYQGGVYGGFRMEYSFVTGAWAIWETLGLAPLLSGQAVPVNRATAQVRSVVKRTPGNGSGRLGTFSVLNN